MINIINTSKHKHFNWLPQQLFFQRILIFLSHVMLKLEIEGLENIPNTGSLLMAGNHLHLIDGLLLVSIMRRCPTFFVKSKMRRLPFNLLLAFLGYIIYVDVGKIDRQAILKARAVLKNGGVLVLAPEGFVSRTGGLLKGQVGVASIATQTNTPVLPIVAYGQEQAYAYWKRFRRAPVTIRIGKLIKLPSGKANKEQLQVYTDQIMIELAKLLPVQYRGVYVNLVSDNDENIT